MATEDRDETVESPEDKTTKDLKARLSAARSKTERFDTARAREALEAEVEEAEREAADADVLDGLIEKYGKIGDRLAALHTSAGMVVVKRPHAANYKKFQEKTDQKIKDVEALVRPCLVYPDASKFDAICEELPATLMRVADLVATLAGVGKGRVEGK